MRLNRQASAVWRFMVSQGWVTLADIARAARCSEASASARLRDFRKDRFGGHTVKRMRVTSEFSDRASVFQYRLVPNKDVVMEVPDERQPSDADR